MTTSSKKIKDYVLNSKNPAALYSLSRLQKVQGLPFDKEKLKDFYRENDVLRQFYGAKNIPKKKIVRNGYACFPLERIHIDLCEMTKQQGNSKYKYILFAVDNFSRYVFYVTLVSKQAGVMRQAALDLLDQMRPFRTLSFARHSVFLSDLGTEFITTFKKVLSDQGHFFVNLATSESKAFYAERFIRTFRALLKIKQVALDLDQQPFEDWAQLLPDIIHTYNNTPHKSLGFKAPVDFIRLTKTAVRHVGARPLQQPLTKAEFLASMRQHEQKRPFKVGDCVNITLTKKNIFAKGSENTKIGLEVFRISKIRPPILNQAKLGYYFLKDLTGKQITGGFYESNLVLIPTSSRRHPDNPNFRKTIGRVVSTKKVPAAAAAAGRKQQTIYKVTFNGKYFIFIEGGGEDI